MDGPVKDYVTFIQLALKMQPNYYITNQEHRVYKQILALQAKAEAPLEADSVDPDQNLLLDIEWR